MSARSGAEAVRRRVVFVTSGLGLGGAETLLLGAAQYCRKVGWDPTVVSLVSDGGVRRVEDLGIPGMALGVSKRGLNVAQIQRLARVIRAERADIVQAWMYHANVFATLTLRLTSVLPEDRLFWGIFNSRMRLGEYPTMTRIVFKLGARWSGRPAGIIYNGERACRDHEADGFHARRNIIIANGIDIERFRPDPAARALTRRQLGIAGDACVVVIVARNDPQKDWPKALAAVRDVPGLVTLACGVGTDRLRPQRNFIRLGARTDMQRIYAAADIFFLPSAFGEGTSVAMSEAAASGLPVVVTDVGDNAGLAREAGAVVSVGDVAAMSRALARLAANHCERRRLGAVARQIAISCFDDRTTYQSIIDAYRSIL
jgi:glycosyltransferase involved in cell wall biosynthesis